MLDTTSATKFNFEPNQTEQKAGKTREELLLDTLPPHIDPNSRAFKEDLKKVDKIAAEEAVRDTLGMTEDAVAVTLLSRQDTTTARLDRSGVLIIEQECWPDENQIVLIGASCIEQFVDGLLDLLGVPSVGRPAQ